MAPVDRPDFGLVVNCRDMKVLAWQTLAVRRPHSNLLRANMNSKLKNFARRSALTIGLVSVAGTALAAGAADTPLPPVPPMPAEVSALGDPDAACVIASADMGSRAQAMINEAPADKREEYMELPMGQIAFYAGKITARLGDSAPAMVTRASSGYVDKTKVADPSPTMRWCYRSYLDLSQSVFNKRVQTALALTGKNWTTDLPPKSLASIDPDALCLVMVSGALPLTMKTAKTNPKAAKGVISLGRAAQFYIGRLMGAKDQSSVERNLADAYIYSGQLIPAKEQQMAQGHIKTCIARYKQTTSLVLEAAKKGLPPGA